MSVLRCPEDGTRLSQENDESSLSCEQGHVFQSRNGVPRFADTDYAGNFGYEWQKFHRTQLDYKQGRLGLEDLSDKAGVHPEDLPGKVVLDAGCGAGRHSVWLADSGAKVIAVDLSEAVESAARNVAGKDVQVIQGDLMRLPVAPNSFDLIVSLGVLHHTPDTRKAFAELIPLLKPGGRISIFVYSIYTSTPGGEFLRRFTPRMRPTLLLRLCRWVGRLRPIYRIPGVGNALMQFLPISMEPDPEMRALDTFDWYSPVYQWKHTYPEVFEWFQEEGLVDIRPLHFPVSMTGVKPF